MRIIGLVVGGLIWSLANQAASFSGEDLPKTTVVKVRSHHANGTVTLGSAVLLGGERLVTNCHVTLGARSTEVLSDGRTWRAEPEAQNIAHDVCLFRAPGIVGIPAVAASDLTPGQIVFAAGFPGGNQLTVTAGRIVALHDFDGAKLIQISSPFDFGASGGGLFNEDGQLIGILAFKARAGGVFHFALPIEWVNTLAGSEPERSVGPTMAFWQQPYEKQPYFLRAVLLQASQNWSALAELGEKWVKLSPIDASAWTALGTALQHLQRTDEAVLALGEAERLRLSEEAPASRHAVSLTYGSTKVASDGHPVPSPVPGFNPTAINVTAPATK